MIVRYGEAFWAGLGLGVWLVVATLLLPLSCRGPVDEPACLVQETEVERTAISLATPADTLGLVTYRIPREVVSLHDPAVAPDGAIWYTDTWASCVGRLDPEAGTARESPTAEPHARPHGVTVDSDGAAWYAGGGGLGRVDPVQGTAETVPLDGVADPHTVLAGGGGVWFAAPGSSVYGRVDGATGAVDVISSLRSSSAPYGLALSPDGRVWVSVRGALLSRSVSTGDERVFALPSAAAEPMRLAVDAVGGVWYVDRARSVLGRLDPTTGTVHEEPTLPPETLPRSLALDGDGLVWYYEGRTDHLVAFDPREGTHTGFELPFPGSAVRHMVYDPVGSRLVLALGDAGRIAVVQLGRARQSAREAQRAPGGVPSPHGDRWITVPPAAMLHQFPRAPRNSLRRAPLPIRVPPATDPHPPQTHAIHADR